MEFANLVSLFSRQWDVIITTVLVKKHTRLQVTLKLRMELNRDNKKEMRREYIQQKGFQIVEFWDWEWWRLYKTDASFKSHFGEIFPY